MRNEQRKILLLSAKAGIQPEVQITMKQANQPIFDRLGRNAPKPAPAIQKSNIDSEADAIRKSWVQSTPVRPKKASGE